MSHFQLHVMATNDLVIQSSLPLDVVAHNATVIVSGVLLGALLAFITFHLGWLRHHVRLNDRLVNAIFPLGPQVFSLHYRCGLL